MHNAAKRAITLALLSVATLFAREGSAQSQIAQLRAHDPSTLHGFGLVAVDSQWIVVGAQNDSDLVPGNGAAYFFERVGTSWIERQKVYPLDPVSSGFFGGAVAIDAGVAVIGASCALDPSGSFRPGAAYVFEFFEGNGQWIERFRLSPSDGASGDMFGDRVAIDGNTILVASDNDDDDRGSVYVFTRRGSSTTWSQQAKLVGSDTGPGDFFGAGLSIENNIAVIGAPFHPDPTFRGAAYVFSRSGTTWQEDAKLLSSDLSNYDFFGISVSVAGTEIAIGASQDNDAGSFYVFQDSGSAWTEIQKHVSPTPVSGGSFGNDIDIDGEFLICGANGELSGGIRTGVGHLYKRSNSVWNYWSRLEAMPAVLNANRGVVVAIDGETVVLGAPVESHSGITAAGVAWVFDAIDSTPSSFCSAKTSSLSCLPFMTSSGEPSASGGPFLVQGNDHVEGQAGLLLYGFKKGSLGFHGGTLCVKPPFRRLSTLVKAADGVMCVTCAGNCRTLTRNFNQYVQTGADPMLTAGQRVNIQWRQRDPSDPLGFGDNLSDGLSFVIGL